VGGTVLLGVTINLTGAGTGSTTTVASGNYSFTALPNGSYTVVPSLTGNTFTPASTAVTISGANSTGTNFSGTANAAATSSGLSGMVSGAVAQNVVINLSGANTGSALTDANGNYSFLNLAAGSYTVTPSLTGYTFSPPSTTVTPTSGGTATGINFTEAAAL
jgi:inhibitor of cysteine peptidase